MNILLSQIVPFDPIQIPEDVFEAVAKSVKEQGFVMPLIVGRLSDGRFRLLDGRMRYQIAQHLGLEKIPVEVVREDVWLLNVVDKRSFHLTSLDAMKVKLWGSDCREWRIVYRDKFILIPDGDIGALIRRLKEME